MHSRALLLTDPAVRRRPRRMAARVLAIVAIVAMIAAALAGVWVASRYNASGRPQVRFDISRPPPPLPARGEQEFLKLDPGKAEEINRSIAVSTAPIEAARPFSIPGTLANLVSRRSAVDCLTAAIYYEAASESAQGQRAVAQVVLNRVRHPAYPKSVCGVVYEGAERRTGCQFTFTCDGSLARKPSQAGWDRARGVALMALAGFVERSVGTATHYHTNYVVPYWAWSLDKITTVGAHIFYRWKGYWGRRSAFNGVYAGEPAADEPGLTLPYDVSGLAEAAAGQEVVTLPLGPRPLADDLGRPAINHGPIAAPVVKPNADQQGAGLLADETAGALIEAAPAPR